MKSLIYKLSLIIAAFLSTLSATAYDFEVDGLLFTITSISGLTARFDGVSDFEAESLTIPKYVSFNGRTLTVTGIYSRALEDNTKIKIISIPSTVTRIGSDAFRNSNLVSVQLPDGLNYLGSGTFAESKIKSISIPQGIKNIYESSFKNCKELQTVDLPIALEMIATNAFQGCESLYKIDFPANLRAIEGEAFADCYSLKEIEIPNSVTFLAFSAIRNCVNLEKLAIGSGLDGFEMYLYQDESFSSYKFHYESFAKGCISLKNIIINNVSEEFSIKGQFNSESTVFSGNYGNWKSSIDIVPTFSSCLIDYFYCGRPLKDIRSWKVEFTRHLENGEYNFNNIANLSIKHGRPFGHIRTLEIAGNCESVPFFYQQVDSLILGKNVSEYDTRNIYLDSINYIQCHAPIPPEVIGNFPKHILLNIPLYVPSGCKSIYEQAAGWKEFWNIIEVSSDSGINDIEDKENSIYLSIVNNDVIVVNKPNNLTIRIFTMDGINYYETYDSVIKNLPKGMYIIIVGNTRFKILV